MVQRQYAHKVNRVTISGTSSTGGEIWTTGFYLGLEGGDAGAVTPVMASAIGAMWQTYFTAANSYTSTNYKTTQIKCAQFNADGSTDEDNVEYYIYGSPISGVSGGAWFPPQIALVATLISSNVRGVAAKGRMFLPGVNIAVNGDGHFSPTEQGNLATAFNTFLSQVNQSVDVPDKVILASSGSAPLYANKANKNVEHIRIGNVYDTQRRRRNALKETYLSRDVAQT